MSGAFWQTEAYAARIAALSTTESNPNTLVTQVEVTEQTFNAGEATGSLNAAGNLKVADANSAQFTSWPTITPNASGVYTPAAGARSIVAVCSAAGNMTLTDGSGDSLTIPIAVGFTTLPFVPASFTTTATATFSGVQ